MIDLKTVTLLNILFSFVLSLVYFYLYSQYREKYMGIWGLSWVLFSARIGMDLFRFMGYSTVALLLLNQIMSMASVVLLLWGIYMFSGKKLPAGWVYAAFLATVATDAGMITRLPLTISVIPTAAYFGLGDIWTGIMFLRCWDIKSLGKRMTGIAFIITGILNLSYPFTSVRGSAATTNWFFTAAFVLWLIILTGILLVYFEKVRKDLKVSEEMFRLLADNAKDIIYRLKIKPSIQFDYISPSLYEITGYSPEELYAAPQLILDIVGKRYNEFLTKSGIDFFINNQAFLLLHAKNGTQVWVELHSVPVYDQEGNVISIEGIARDVTERKKAEAEMARLEQLRLIGQTAAGIAHEIRNPMTTVKGFLQLLMEKNELEKYLDYFGLMIAELDRANSIITQFLSLSKEKKSVLKLQSVNTVICNLKPLLEASALVTSKNIEFRLADLPDLYLDESEIGQVLFNLVQNGLEAMEPGGTLEICTTQGEGQVILHVRDHGRGFEPGILGRAGEPFITTKEDGTGLGLAVCYSIAYRHDAKIEIVTGQDGTTVSVIFPAGDTLQESYKQRSQGQ